MTSGLFATDPVALGQYRLLGRLGRGGMGQVYLGRSPGGRLVAVKVIRPDFAADPDFRARFAREVANARNVSGMFTAPVVDADTDGPVPWLATAYVPGPSLSDAVRGSGPLPVHSLLPLAAGLAEALTAIHAAGLVHRDLKPSNVLLAADGPRVIDFGISHAAEASTLTPYGAVMGSPGYMSPEQARGEQVGPLSDVFSLGAVLAFAATAEGPFGGGSADALIHRVVNRSPALDQVPGELRPLIARCLAKDPVDRPSPSQLLAAWGGQVIPADWLPETVADSLPRYAPAARVAALAESQSPAAPMAALGAQPAEPPTRIPQLLPWEPRLVQPDRELPTATVAPQAGRDIPASGPPRHSGSHSLREQHQRRGLSLSTAWRTRPRVLAVALAIVALAAAVTLSANLLGARAGTAAPESASMAGDSAPSTHPGSPSGTPAPAQLAPSHPTAQSATPAAPSASRTASTAPATGQSASASSPASSSASSPEPSSASSPEPSPTASGASAAPLTATNAVLASCATYPMNGFATINDSAFEVVNNTADTVNIYYTDLGATIWLADSLAPHSTNAATLWIGGTYIVQGAAGNCIAYFTVSATSGMVTVNSAAPSATPTPTPTAPLVQAGG